MISTRARLIRLTERRMRLTERAQAEREALAAAIGHTDEVAALLQRVRGIADQLRRQPWIPAAVVGLALALQPRRALGWLMKGWSAWRLYRGAQRWWAQVAGRNPGAA